MRIGIDARTILDPKGREGAGVGHYCYHLIENLLELDSENEYFLYFDSRIKDTSSFDRGNVTVRRFPFIQYGRFMPVAYSHFLVSAFLNKDKLDLFHSPTGAVPLSYRRPTMVTVHDLAVYHQKNWYSKNEELNTKLVVPRTIRQASKVITGSEFIKQDVVTRFGVSDDKVEAIHNGVDPLLKDEVALEKNNEVVRKKFGIDGRFVLYVGSLLPRKNVRGLVAAFDKLTKDEAMAGLKLVLAGREGWNYKKILTEVSSRGLNDRVVFTGYVSPEDKYSLLSMADVFVFPSYYEGFGLSVLEAMYFETPVITSSISSLPEIVGDAGVLIDPYNTTQIADAMDSLLSDEAKRNELVAKGKERVRQFSWENTARKTHAIYEEVVKSTEKKKEMKKEKAK